MLDPTDRGVMVSHPSVGNFPGAFLEYTDRAALHHPRNTMCQQGRYDLSLLK